MQRKEIRKDAIVRYRPGRYSYNSQIGRLVSDEPVGTRRMGYYGKTYALVEVEWYATLAEDGTIRMWDERRTEKADARKLVIIDLPKLAAEKASWHKVTEAGRREKEANVVRTEANLATMRTILNDEYWGYAMNDGRDVKISDKQLAALVALVSKVVAS